MLFFIRLVQIFFYYKRFYFLTGILYYYQNKFSRYKKKKLVIFSSAFNTYLHEVVLLFFFFCFSFNFILHSRTHATEAYRNFNAAGHHSPRQPSTRTRIKISLNADVEAGAKSKLWAQQDVTKIYFLCIQQSYSA